MERENAQNSKATEPYHEKKETLQIPTIDCQCKRAVHLQQSRKIYLLEDRTARDNTSETF
jgi:hypothetical protein